jgi:ATP-dependent Lon protease
MPRDSQPKMSNKKSTVSKKRDERVKNKKQIESSDSSDDTSASDDDSENEMDAQEYRKFLKGIFPSKHLSQKIKAGERIKKVLKDEDLEEEENDDDLEEADKKGKKCKKIEKGKEKDTKGKEKGKEKGKKGKKIVIESDDSDGEDLGSEDSETEDSETEYSETEYSETEDSETEDSETEDSEESNNKSKNKGKKDKQKPSKFNIVFTIGGLKKKEDEDDDESNSEDWESCSNSESESDTENEDDPISDTDEDSEEEDENSEESIEESEDSEWKPTKKVKKNKDNKYNKKTVKIVKKDNNTKKVSEEEDGVLINKLKNDLDEKKSEQKDSKEDVIAMLKDLQSRNKNNVLVNECLKVCEKKIVVNKKKQEHKIKREKERNGRIFKRILRDKNTMNDFDFYDKLEMGNQKKIIKELREINKITRVEKPYRLTLLESDIPVNFKSAAMKKISSIRHMEPGSGEYYKIKNWVDTFMRIPFNKYENLPISITDGVERCHDFMAKAQKTLDEAVYGLNDAKMQIMQMLGQLITNPDSIGSAIAIHGQPGTGKTSLVKEGISKILNRPFAFIALGGATDSSFLEGHGYTYEGSTWGKIVQILIDSKCMNPVIYFDELDKISDTPKGEEIAGILTHLTDTSQNTQFHDKYFTEIDFDLSKCLFIFSYNDESKVNPILKDRMYRIQTKGYNQKQKTVISNNYLLPKIREQVKFAAADIIIPDQTLHYIIENYCNKEDGVRNLKRCLEIIYTKLNLYRLMRPGSNLFEEDMSIKVEFPFTVTKDIVEKMIKKTSNGLDPSLQHLYI